MSCRRPPLLAGLATLILASGVAGAASPYAHLELRPVKALAPEQVEDLRAGRGMGLALAAELNGYPGPRHVLELVEELRLSPEQRAKTEALFAEMRAGAVDLGERVIAGESALERMFAEGQADEASVQEAALALGELQGTLRAHHLRYHLAMHALLTPEQGARYQELRGYAAGHGARHGHH